MATGFPDFGEPVCVAYPAICHHDVITDPRRASPKLQRGTVCRSGMAVASSPIETLHDCTVQFRGAIDALLAFADGTYGIVDYRTTDPRETKVDMYGRQLHAYAMALEHPSPGTQQFLSRVELGLLRIQPTGMVELDGGDFAYLIAPLLHVNGQCLWHRQRPNEWGFERGEPRYILDLIKRVVTVSLRTVESVAGLSPLSFGEDGVAHQS